MQTFPMTPTMRLVNGPEWCPAYEDHMRQSTIPSTASANDGHLGSWVTPTLQQSALQLQDNQTHIPLQLPNGKSSTVTYNPTNAPCPTLPITHTYPNTGYSVPSGSALQSLPPAISSPTEIGHHVDFADCQVLESVPQWYSQPLVTGSQSQWTPLYICTVSESAMASGRPEDQKAQIECLERPSQRWFSQSEQYSIVHRENA